MPLAFDALTVWSTKPLAGSEALKALHVKISEAPPARLKNGRLSPGAPQPVGGRAGREARSLFPQPEPFRSLEAAAATSQVQTPNLKHDLKVPGESLSRI